MQGWRLVAPTHLAIDRDGRLWISDPGLRAVVVVAPGGRVIARHGAGADAGPAALAAPAGLAVSARGGHVYVSDARTGELWRIDPAAAGDAAYQRVATGLVGALDVAVDDDAGRVYAVGPRGLEVTSLASPDAPDSLAGAARPVLPDALAREVRPVGLALAPDRRRLYAVDAASPGLIAIELATGECARVAALPGAAAGAGDGAGKPAVRVPDTRVGPHAGVAITPMGVAAVDPADGLLVGVNVRHGTVVAIWRGAGDLALVAPAGVAWDHARRCYFVADPGAGRVIRIERDAASASALITTR